MENPKDRDRGRDRDRDRDPSFEEVPPPVMLTMGFWVFGVEKCKIKKKKTHRNWQDIEASSDWQPATVEEKRPIARKKGKIIGKNQQIYHVCLTWRNNFISNLFKIETYYHNTDKYGCAGL